MTDIEDMSVSELEGRALDYLETLTQEERERFATFLRMYADMGGADARDLRSLATTVERGS